LTYTTPYLLYLKTIPKAVVPQSVFWGESVTVLRFAFDLSQSSSMELTTYQYKRIFTNTIQ